MGQGSGTLEGMLTERIAGPLRGELVQYVRREMDANESALLATLGDLMSQKIGTATTRQQERQKIRTGALCDVLKRRFAEYHDKMVAHVRQELDAADDAFKTKLGELSAEVERLKREVVALRERASKPARRRRLKISHADGTESIIREEDIDGASTPQGRLSPNELSDRARDLAIKNGITYDEAKRRLQG